MSTWLPWKPSGPTAPWGPSWSLHPRYCRASSHFPVCYLTQWHFSLLCVLSLVECSGFPLACVVLPWSLGSICGGCEAGADLL